MIERGEGRILNVASVASFNPTPGAAVYGATKAFVLSLSEALSEELKPHGIAVTALCPGLTETGFSKAATGKAGTNPAVPAFMKLDARQVAREGFDALHSGEVVRINGLAYQIGVEWLRYTPRPLARAMGAMFGKQLEDGF
jgi:short-subunit dehydrogenase